ncbi:MAG: hypothetical protein PHC88_03430 [Terrimicrobiaceae bacterium]|nr:hypothetical protein [Terrimicrobiaceae bacterium]
MRLNLSLSGLLLFCVCFKIGLASAADNNSTTSGITGSIAQRVDKGDISALLEMSNIPAPGAIPFLTRFLRSFPKDTEQYQIAREAIIKNPETISYFRKRLAASTEKQGVDQDAFEVLSMLATPDSVTIVAPYLFRFEVREGHGDMLADVNAISAAQALGAMNLPDAPTDKPPGAYKAEDFLAWQKWAITKRLVPAATQTNVPRWLTEMDASASPAIRTADPPQNSEQKLSTPRPSATTTPTVAPENPASTGFPILPMAILGALIVAAAVFLLRHKSP